MLAGIWLTVSSPPARADDPARISGRVTDVLGHPLHKARVYVIAGGAQQLVLQTDAAGRFEGTVYRPGKLTVVAAFSGASAARDVTVDAGAPATVELELPTTADGGEVIELQGAIDPPVKPQPKFDVRRAPRYSDEAVLRDAWTRAWLLLDVDERGTVQRLKFLKRPGLELETIAREEAFKLSFTPARDATGKPVRTLVVWDIEWPSHEWLLANTGLAVRIPHWSAAVPCYGSGPLDFNDPHPTYRDCSRPDLSRAAQVRWVERK